MVILGCAGELIFVLHEYLDDKKTWYKARTRRFISFPAEPSSIVLILELLSVAFVVIGISGELYVDVTSSRLETKLREANGQLVLLLEGRANDAETSAKNAQASADAVGREAEQAKKTVDIVGKRAEAIDQKLDMAQYFLSARELRDPALLKSQLSAFKGKTFIFRSYVNDGEGYFLCKKLTWVASDAGVVATDQCGLFQVERPFIMLGINIWAPTEEVMLTLNKEFAAATLYGSGGAVSSDGGTIVFVGGKPGAHVGQCPNP